MARVLVQVVALLAIVASVLGDVAWVKKNEDFMKENANAAGIISLPSGCNTKCSRQDSRMAQSRGPRTSVKFITEGNSLMVRQSLRAVCVCLDPLDLIASSPIAQERNLIPRTSVASPPSSLRTRSSRAGPKPFNS